MSRGVSPERFLNASDSLGAASLGPLTLTRSPDGEGIQGLAARDWGLRLGWLVALRLSLVCCCG